jgi:ribosomal protein S18 acetylase RimI-like enzyme
VNIIFFLLILFFYSLHLAQAEQPQDIHIQRFTPHTLHARNQHSVYQGTIRFDTAKCSLDKPHLVKSADSTILETLYAEAIFSLKESGCLQVKIQKDMADFLKERIVDQRVTENATGTYINTDQAATPAARPTMIIPAGTNNEVLHKAFIADEPAAVGFAQTNYESCTMTNLHVIDTFQGRGIGKALFIEAMKDLQVKGCLYAQWKSFKEAVVFYQKQGATIVKYEGDLVSMKLNLEKEL